MNTYLSPCKFAGDAAVDAAALDAAAARIAAVHLAGSDDPSRPRQLAWDIILPAPN